MDEKTSDKQKARLEEKYERPFKSKNFADSMKNAFAGIFYTIRTQTNIKIQLGVAIIVIIFAAILKVQIVEIVCLTISIFMVLFAEMLNTAVETTVDLITQEYNIKAKIAKDIMAGAVLLTSINSIIIGFLVFFDEILNWGQLLF